MDCLSVCFCFGVATVQTLRHRRVWTVALEVLRAVSALFYNSLSSNQGVMAVSLYSFRGLMSDSCVFFQSDSGIMAIDGAHWYWTAIVGTPNVEALVKTLAEVAFLSDPWTTPSWERVNWPQWFDHWGATWRFSSAHIFFVVARKRNWTRNNILSRPITVLDVDVMTRRCKDFLEVHVSLLT